MLVLVSIAFALCILSGFYQKWATNKPLQATTNITNFSVYTIYIVSILTNQGVIKTKCTKKQFLKLVFFFQGNYVQPKQTSLRVAAGMYCLMALVFINAYAGNLVSYLTVPKLKPIVNSFEDLALSLELKLAVDARSIMANRFLVSD